MSLQLAIEDLAITLDNSEYLDRIDTLPLTPGSSRVGAVVGVGSQTTERNYGKDRVVQQLDITLTVKTKIEASELAEILNGVDKDIIRDRRRSGLAQTTVLDEEGWTPEESDKKEFTVMTRFVEVHVYEDQV